MDNRLVDRDMNLGAHQHQDINTTYILPIRGRSNSRESALTPLDLSEPVRALSFEE